MIFACSFTYHLGYFLPLDPVEYHSSQLLTLVAPP